MDQFLNSSLFKLANTSDKATWSSFYQILPKYTKYAQCLAPIMLNIYNKWWNSLSLALSGSTREKDDPQLQTYLILIYKNQIYQMHESNWSWPFTNLELFKFENAFYVYS